MQVSGIEKNQEVNVVWGLMGAMISTGAFCSAFFSNYLVARFGMKKTLLGTNLLAIIGSVLTAISVYVDSYEVAIVGRFLSGTNIGVAFAVVPAYITEISPPHLRGAMGTIPGVNYTVGCLAGVVVGMPQLLGTVHLWPGIFWLAVIPAVFPLYALPFCPETPRYLLIRRKSKTQAERALSWLRGTPDVTKELQMMKSEAEHMETQEIVQIFNLLKKPFHRKTILIIVIMFLVQQFSGMMGIIVYSTSIFEEAGLKKSAALYGSISLMSIQIISVVASVMLSDRVGRRSLLLFSNFCVVLYLIGLVLFITLQRKGLCDECRYGSVVMVILFMLFYNLGLRATWVMTSEMFELTSRAAAMTVATIVCTGSALLVSLTFPLVSAYLDQWIFAVFAGITFAGSCFLYLRLIETKGKDFSEIQVELRLKLK